MINSLYIFSKDLPVVADEWNANFKAIHESNVACSTAIVNALNALAFPDSDFTAVFGLLDVRHNSFGIPGNNVVIAPQCEYFKTLGSGKDLNIQIPTGFNSEARIAIKILDNRTLLPFSVSYAGNLNISYGEDDVFNAGTYFILIYEIAGNAFVKLIWTGV